MKNKNVITVDIHMTDIFTWVNKIINSCITHKQLRVSMKLIHQFEKMYPEEEALICILRAQENIKFFNINKD